jgi:ABC-type glycerol-3-phosphate transport system permease component
MRTPRAIPATIVNLLIGIGGLAVAFPYFYMVISSLKRQDQIYQIPISLIPNPATLADYQQLFSNFPFPRWFLNSAIVAVGSTAATLIVCSLAGFALAKYEFRGRKTIFILMIATLTLPFQILLVPLFKEMSAFAWLNTYWALIVPFAGSAFGVFLMRQFMLSVPTALLEAGRIDGASEFTLYWRVALPLVRTGLAMLALLSFITSWNDFLWPLVATSSDDMYLLNIGIATMSSAYKIEYGSIMAASVLTTLPIAVIFLTLQRQFIAGLTAGALKG